MPQRPLRNTVRKTLIRQLLSEEYVGNPVLLEELRWRVLLREFEANSLLFEAMTASHMKSFVRTIREHMPEVGIHKLKRPDLVPVGIVARAAVYRIRQQVLLAKVLNTDALSVFCSIHQERAVKGKNMVGCFLCINGQDRKASDSFAIFPTTKALSLVGRFPSVNDLFDLASSASCWRLFRVDDHGNEVSISHEQPIRVPSKPEKWMVQEKKLYNLFWKSPDRFVRQPLYRKRLSELLLNGFE